VPADLATPRGASDLVAAAADRCGIDVLVNNAGSLTVHPQGFASMTDEDWQASWNLNVMGTVRPTRAALPQMYRRGGGSIVIVGSMRAYYPDPAYYDYCATKAAVTNIAKALSKELGPKNIRVNSVSPGPVSTPLWLDATTAVLPDRCRSISLLHSAISARFFDRSYRKAATLGRTRTFEGQRQRPDRRRSRGIGRQRRRDRSVHHARRSRRPGHLPGQRPLCQYHRG
jgi:NAD(P)-dependent dehydrogenase (short-subunit alcohol dehydrogenase family)